MEIKYPIKRLKCIKQLYLILTDTITETLEKFAKKVYQSLSQSHKQLNN